jgi:hypothetical protein
MNHIFSRSASSVGMVILEEQRHGLDGLLDIYMGVCFE